MKYALQGTKDSGTVCYVFPLHKSFGGHPSLGDVTFTWTSHSP
ncbi:hypothetical protein Hdeb2414_s0011g00369481 [Helianthus debilis subsp. tardiflorus]